MQLRAGMCRHPSTSMHFPSHLRGHDCMGQGTHNGQEHPLQELRGEYNKKMNRQQWPGGAACIVPPGISDRYKKGEFVV